MVNAYLDENKYSIANTSVYLNSGYLQAPPGVYFNGDFTIIAWIKLNQSVTWSRLFDFANLNYLNHPTDQLHVILSNLAGNVESNYYVDGVNECPFSSSKSLRLGQWDHVAVTLSISQAQIYINGQFVGGQSSFNSPSNIIRQYCYFGRNNWNINELAIANFDEIKIYNRSLSSDEINYDMSLIN